MESNGKTEPNGKYRFSLQFGADTPERAQVGEFLKSLGNRKSGVIVAAVAAYLKERPEMLTAGQRPQIVLQTGLSDERLKELIRMVVDEKFAGVTQTTALLPTGDDAQNDSACNRAMAYAGDTAAAMTEAVESGIAAMLQNVDLFS